MEKYYNLFDELKIVTDQMLINHPEPSNDKKGVFLLFVITKSFKTLNAIELLCKNGMGEDASMLCRSLFELNLNTAYIMEDKTDNRVERFFAFDWIQRKRMYDYLKRSRSADQLNTPDQIKMINEIECKAAEVQDKYNYHKTRWSDRDIFKIAEYLGIVDIYHTAYYIQCSVSHSSPRIINNYVDFDDNGQFILNSGPSTNLVEETLSSTVILYYELLEHLNKYFQKGYDEKLDDLKDKLMAMSKTTQDM